MPTAWSHSGSLVSDRIRTHPTPSKPPAKSKGPGRAPEPPAQSKSKLVRALEARLDGARRSNGQAKDPKGGCFCQARKHALSEYVKICRRCGLILCTLNPPYYACPHCTSALMNDHERKMLVERLDGELAEQVAKEEAGRQKAIEEARTRQGDFPTLTGSAQAHAQMQMRTSRTPPPRAPLATAGNTRTVLSLNSETKKVTVSSYSTPVPSRPASRAEEKEEELGRVPGPPGEVSYVKDPVDPERPWKNVRAGDVRYVPPTGDTKGKTSKREPGR